MTRFKRVLTVFFCLFVVFLATPVAHVASAAGTSEVTGNGPSWWPIVPCGINKPTDSKGNLLDKPWPLADSYYENCNQCTLIKLLKNLIDFLFYGIVPVVGTFFFVLAGFKILLGSNKPGAIQDGMKMMRTTAIGIAIIMGSWLITNFILKSLISEEYLDNTAPWYQIQCSNNTLEDLVDATNPKATTSPTDDPGNPGTSTYSCNSNNQCVKDPDGEYSNSTCDNECDSDITPQAYTCDNIVGQCVADPDGEYESSDCNNDCIGPGAQQYSCNTNGQCVADPGGQYSNSSCDNECQAPVLVFGITTSTLSDAVVGKSYTQSINAAGGNAPYKYSVSAGSLPAGLSMGLSGIITGTPTAAGTSTFTVEAKDSSGSDRKTSKQLSIKIISTAAASVTISNVAATNVTTTAATITWQTDKGASGEVEYGPTTAYGKKSDVILSQSTAHSISLPGLTQGTTYHYRAISAITGFTARSSDGSFKTQGVAPTATPTRSATPSPTRTASPTPTSSPGSGFTVTTASLPNAIQNQNYSQTLVANGGKIPYSWSLAAGTLPPGLNLNTASGAITGKPTTVGTSNITFKVQDSSSPKQSANKQLSIKVNTAASSSQCGNMNAVCTATSCPSLIKDAGVPTTQSNWSYLIPQVATTHAISGVNTTKFLEAIMRIESNGKLAAQSGSTPPSCGLMQMQAGIANTLRQYCGVSHEITCEWLRGKDLQAGETLETVAKADICLAAEYFKSTTRSACYTNAGSNVKDLAAGYNGGDGCNANQSRDQALALSKSCSSASTAAEKYEVDCNGRKTLRYECVFDDLEHTTCNVGFAETRGYVQKFNACYGQ